MKVRRISTVISSKCSKHIALRDFEVSVDQELGNQIQLSNEEVGYDMKLGFLG